MRLPNLDVTPNVMVEQDGSSAEIRYLPGDLAIAVYARDRFGNKQLIKRGLTEKQYIEYLQYLRCQRCGVTCAGTCSE
jgi:hypothetical protein